MSEEEGHGITFLIEVRTENLVAVGQNLMKFITEIIEFDCLTQEIPASLLLIFTVIVTTSLSKRHRRS